MKNSKAIDEFVGRLKDPYYGRPVYIRHDAPIGSYFHITVEATGEIISFGKVNRTSWGVYGTDRKVRMMETRQAENLVTDYVLVAHKQNKRIIVSDVSENLVIRKYEMMYQYV